MRHDITEVDKNLQLQKDSLDHFQKKHEYFLAAQKTTGSKSSQRVGQEEEKAKTAKVLHKIPPLEKYLRDQGVSSEDVKSLDSQIHLLSEAAEFKDDIQDKLELFGKVEQLFVNLVEKRQMGTFYGKKADIADRERELKTKRKGEAHLLSKELEMKNKDDKKRNMEKK